jgi:hypothetical protein
MLTGGKTIGEVCQALEVAEATFPFLVRIE